VKFDKKKLQFTLCWYNCAGRKLFGEIDSR